MQHITWYSCLLRCILLNQFRFRQPSFFGMCILSTHSSENGRFGRSPKPSNHKRRTFSRLLRGLRFVSRLAVLPQVSRIFRIHILLKFEILFLEAYRFQNSEGLEGLKEYALNGCQLQCVLLLTCGHVILRA